MPAPITPVGFETYAKSLTAGMLQVQGLSASPAAAAAAAPLKGAAGNFQNLLASAIQNTASLQNQAEAREMEFMAGDVEELHGLMIAQEKASLAFQLTLQVRNKLVDAYQEVMRMQI